MSSLDTLRQNNFIRRLFDKDASLWSEGPQQQARIRNRLGWLTVAEEMAERSDELVRLADEVRERAYERVVLLGMGGSSLAPEVFERVFGPRDGHPPLTVLDTTDPSAILELGRSLDLARTLFIVSSKSGTTLETITLYRYFAAKYGGGEGQDVRLDNFVCITDPGTPLADQAQRAGFLRVFPNPPDIGGRYSALSYFGLVPAASIGVHVRQLLERAEGLETKAGLGLGATLADNWQAGRDKVTFLVPAGGEPASLAASFGPWAEQLLAESLGKDGKGVIPIAGEPAGPPGVYGHDRVFVRMQVGGRDDGMEGTAKALEDAGHPVITLRLDDEYDLGAEFLRWETATAALGAVMGVNAFDEPNVDESKENTRRVLEEAARAGRVPDPQPAAIEDGLAVCFGEGTAQRLGLRGEQPIASLVGALQGREGDYFALQAYIQPAPDHGRLLTEIRTLVRDNTRLVTTAGYGPRYLHSTGQLHKGGPDSGIFLQLTCDDPVDAPIPGESAYGFSVVKRAQALGDFQSLERHGRRVMRVHLGRDVTGDLRKLLDRLRSSVPASAGSRGR